MPKPLAVVPDLDLELDNLHALPPAQFTPARNDLARRLKQAGRGDAAAEVKRLRKPTIPVWVVNQLARGHRDELGALLQASEQLRAAQGRALAGAESSKLREATAAQRDALHALTHRAHELLTAAGQSATSQTIDRVASTLRAAALDPAGRELLERGRLGEELDPSGFEALAGMPTARPRPRSMAAKRSKPAAEKRRQERARRLREDARKAEAAADEAERQAAEAERQAAAAAADATRARRAAERAQTALEAVEQASE